MSIQSILVAFDLSAAENAAVLRAQQLARAHNASLRLLYVPRHGERRVADADAKLHAMARRAEAELMIDVQALPAATDAFHDIAADLRGIDLLVVPHRCDRTLASFFHGQPVIRLLRRCEVPVLVVRRMPDKPYGRVVVAIDHSKHAETVGALASALQPLSEVRLLHALSTSDESKLAHAGVSGRVIRAYRERSVSRARSTMLSIARRLSSPGHRPLILVRHGDPARQAVVQQESSGADLIAVGKERSSACSDFVWASVARNVLAWGTSDVLIVPRPRAFDGSPSAGRRRSDRGMPPSLRGPEGRSVA